MKVPIEFHYPAEFEELVLQLISGLSFEIDGDEYIVTEASLPEIEGRGDSFAEAFSNLARAYEISEVEPDLKLLLFWRDIAATASEDGI